MVDLASEPKSVTPGVEHYRGPYADANERWHLESKRDFETAKMAGEPFAVVIIDLNNLKYTNDTYGHSAGNRALAIVSKVLDKLGTGGVRIGGDEFAIARTMTKEEAEAMVQAIRDGVTGNLINGKNKDLIEARADVSIGLSTHDPGQDESIDGVELIGDADKAMYVDKRSRLPDLTEHELQAIEQAKAVLRAAGVRVRLRDFPNYAVKYPKLFED